MGEYTVVTIFFESLDMDLEYFSIIDNYVEYYADYTWIIKSSYLLSLRACLVSNFIYLSLHINEGIWAILRVKLYWLYSQISIYELVQSDL